MGNTNLGAVSLLKDRLVAGAFQRFHDSARAFFDSDRQIIDTKYGPIRSTPSVLWEIQEDRTRSRYFHGFLFINEWLDYLLISKNKEFIEYLADLIESWQRMHPVSNWKALGMAYHDETTAQRSNILLALFIVARSNNFNECADRLKVVLDETVNLLATDDFHSGLNNHGMFQDISVRNYALVADWRSESELFSMLSRAAENLKSYFVHSFTSEGVHVENTPTYHLMVAKNLQFHIKLLETISHSDVQVLSELLNKAGSYATHAVMPNGEFPPISDTTIMKLRSYAGNSFDSKFSYAASAGTVGTKPEDTRVVFPKSGYAIYRSDWHDARATYLFFSAAYNNNYHKHSDDLSLILYASGQEIITESGPYSYNYSDPYSKYAYSQYSHNNIIVDGKSTARTDANSDKVAIKSFSNSDKLFTVVGETGRLNRVVHKREVAVTGDPRRESIEVSDVLSSSDTHEYEMLWNIAPGLVPVMHGNGFELFDRGTKILDCLFTAEVPVNLSWHEGETKQPLLGWKFPAFGKKTRGGVVRVAFEASGNASIKSRFALSEWNYKNRGIQLGAADGWKVFKHKKAINYLEMDSKKEAPTSLIFVFSAMAPIGDFSYNYKSTLDSIDAKIFYILDDFGDQGSYYLQEHYDRGIYETVQKFISLKVEEHMLDNSTLYFLGSSKGGTAAMLHGSKFKNARIIVGAPQTKIGSFVSKPHPNVLSYMTTGNTQADIEALDQVLYDPSWVFAAGVKVTVLVGTGDHHYRNHVLPWFDHARKVGISAELRTLPGTPHSEIGAAYRKFLTEVLVPQKPSNELRSQLLDDLRLQYDSSSKDLIASVAQIDKTETVFRLYRDSELLSSHPYETSNTRIWSNLPAGRYRVRVFRRLIGSTESEIRTGPWALIEEI